VDFCLNNLVYNAIPEELFRIHALPSTFWYVLQLQLIEDASRKTDALTEKVNFVEIREETNCACLADAKILSSGWFY
jgi:hypothetical protein